MSEPIDLELNSAEDSAKHLSKHLDHAPITQDAVFGEITEEGPNFRDVGG